MKPIEFEIPLETWAILRPRVRRLFPRRKVKVGWLLTTRSVKAEKSQGIGILDAICYLAPAQTISKHLNLCTSSSKHCRKICIAWTGQLGMPSGFKALCARAIFYHAFPKEFRDRLDFETKSLLKRAEKKGYSLSIRLNGTSDIAWELPANGRYIQHAMGLFPTVKYYDYTKHAGRCFAGYLKSQNAEGYHLTFSFSGENHKLIDRIDPLVSIAVPFSGAMPSELWGRAVIDGDQHDIRWLDPQGSIVGLKFKLPRRVEKQIRKGTVKASEVKAMVIQ